MTATGTQIETLMEFMLKNPDQARGLIHSVEGRVKAKNMWEDLSKQLNSLGGAVKTVQQWKKVWAGKKYLTKKANAAARRSATGTGGGPSTAGILSHNDLKVIAVMGDGFGEPDMPGCNVPAFPKPLEQPTPLPDATFNNSNEELEATEDQNLRPSNNVQVSRRLRRRIRGAQTDAKSQILRLEEEKKEIMAGILGELKALN